MFQAHQYYEDNYTALYPHNNPPKCPGQQLMYPDQQLMYPDRPAPAAVGFWGPAPPAPQGAWFPGNSPPPPPPPPRPYHVPWNPFAVNNYKAAPVPFTEDQVRQVFMQFDLNRDNVLSREEIRQAFNYLGAMFPAQKARKGIKLADGNGDGVVDMSELDDLVKYAYNLGYVVR